MVRWLLASSCHSWTLAPFIGTLVELMMQRLSYLSLNPQFPSLDPKETIPWIQPRCIRKLWNITSCLKVSWTFHVFAVIQWKITQACLEHLHGHAERAPFRRWKAMAKHLNGMAGSFSGSRMSNHVFFSNYLGSFMSNWYVRMRISRFRIFFPYPLPKGSPTFFMGQLVLTYRGPQKIRSCPNSCRWRWQQQQLGVFGDSYICFKAIIPISES